MATSKKTMIYIVGISSLIMLITCQIPLTIYDPPEDLTPYYVNYCPTVNNTINATVPVSSADCNRYSDAQTYCCYITPYSGPSTSPMCYALAVTDYNGAGTFNYNQTSYDINCGLGTKIGSVAQNTGTGTSCGPANPLAPGACHLASTITNSCCYYNYDGASGCYWLGAKYKGATQFGGTIFKCSASFYSISITLISLVALILFF